MPSERHRPVTGKDDTAPKPANPLESKREYLARLMEQRLGYADRAHISRRSEEELDALVRHYAGDVEYPTNDHWDDLLIEGPEGNGRRFIY